MAEETTIEREFIVGNKYGIHARPAALLVKSANQFSCDILIGKKGTEVSAKSIMGLLTIEGHPGATLMVRTVGEDAAAAMEAIAELFDSNFQEE